MKEETEVTEEQIEHAMAEAILGSLGSPLDFLKMLEGARIDTIHAAIEEMQFEIDLRFKPDEILVRIKIVEAQNGDQT